MAKTNRNGIGEIYKIIDVPSDKIYTCFYCGCISTDNDHVPPASRYHDYFALYDRHQPLLVPACKECNGLLSNSLQPDIYKRFEACKKLLTKKYTKVIRYGDIWDEDTADYAEFSGSFEIFVQQAQRMSEIAKKRLDWMHWSVCVDGVEIGASDDYMKLSVNGKAFISLDHLFDYARKVDKIPTKYLESVLDLMGMSKIQKAYTLCKMNPIKSESELRKILKEIKEEMEHE